LKKLISIFTVSIVLFTIVFSSPAEELSEAIRTVKLNNSGDTIILTLRQVQEGKGLFTYTCSACHIDGLTRGNTKVTLGSSSLAGATPPRDNVEALVDYMKNPTTYDGETEISELHPSMKSKDIFTKMKNLTDDNLRAIAGHILLQPKILGPQWGRVQ
jgi:photosystem II cytochrome c550